MGAGANWFLAGAVYAGVTYTTADEVIGWLSRYSVS